MAIIKFGAVVVGARGTIGGLIFTAGKAGPYVRNWARGANPRSDKQSRQRSRFSYQPELWRALDDTERDAWNDFAADPAQELINALGEPYFASGYAWFVKINTRLARAGYGPRTDPPTDAAPAVPVIDSFTYEDSGGTFVCEITYDPAEFPSGTDIVIFAAAVPRGARMVQYPGYRLLISTIASPTGTYDFAIDYEAVFGVPQLEERCFLRVYKQTDQGMRGGPFETFASYA